MDNVTQEVLQTIDWADIESRIAGGTLRLTHTAKELGLKAADFKKLLIARYGSRITFKRGRSGGVYWSTN